jgi:hypothetical protein
LEARCFFRNLQSFPQKSANAAKITGMATLYFWHYRDVIRKGRITATRYRCTEAEARERFGDALIGPVPGSAEERREPTPEEINADSASQVNRP